MELAVVNENPRLEHGNSKRARQILALLAGRVLTIEQIGAECGITPSAAAKALWRLKNEMGVPVVSLGEDAWDGDGHHGPELYTIMMPAGRVCAEPGCGTVLCRHNPSRYCYAHGRWTWSP
jgi:hypothetical protein